MREPDPLNELEQRFAEKLHALFAQVQPQKPEKGIQTMLRRARTRVAQTGEPLESVLEEMYRGAAERTERRVRLLNQCSLNPGNETER